MNFLFRRRLPQQHQKKKKRDRSLLRWIIILQIFILTWACLISWIVSNFSYTTKASVRGASIDKSTFAYERVDSNEIAQEVPGIELWIPSPNPGQDEIQVVYATTVSPAKGVVLLLHACTHTALKFFSLSRTCLDCVGLSEEMRITRIVLEHGYMPVAVTCINRKSGCWSNADFLRIQTVLQHELFRNHDIIYGIGASSGGSFAAQLLVKDTIKGALVIVMSLSSGITSSLKINPKPLFLAPMPRDKHTTAGAISNYQDLKVLNADNKELIALDTESCDSLPVTSSYLLSRVVGMTASIADTLIADLTRAKHIDKNQLLVVDPTKSNWREIVSPKNSTHLMNKFALKPGYSPLAKALHRAWAYHEYCSEVVAAALNLFERNLGGQ
jgi:hypothetical protein